MAIPSGPVAASTDVERAMFDFVDAYDRAYDVAAAEHGLSTAQACVLGRLEESRGMGELALELGCDASNITQIINRLQARGLVDREADPADRRSRRIIRTAEGDQIYAAFETTFVFGRLSAASLSPREQAQLAALLRKTLTRD